MIKLRSVVPDLVVLVDIQCLQSESVGFENQSSSVTVSLEFCHIEYLVM